MTNFLPCLGCNISVAVMFTHYLFLTFIHNLDIKKKMRRMLKWAYVFSSEWVKEFRVCNVNMG